MSARAAATSMRPGHGAAGAAGGAAARGGGLRGNGASSAAGTQGLFGIGPDSAAEGAEGSAAQPFSDALAQARDRGGRHADEGPERDTAVSGADDSGASRAAPAGSARAPGAGTRNISTGSASGNASTGNASTGSATADGASAADTASGPAVTATEDAVAAAAAELSAAEAGAVAAPTGGQTAAAGSRKTTTRAANDAQDTDGSAELAALALLLGAGAAAVLATQAGSQQSVPGGGLAATGATGSADAAGGAAAGGGAVGTGNAAAPGAGAAGAAAADSSAGADAGGSADSGNPGDAGSGTGTDAAAGTLALTGNLLQALDAPGTFVATTASPGSAKGATSADSTTAAGLAGATPLPPSMTGPAAAALATVTRSIGVPLSDPGWSQALAAQVQWLAGQQIHSATLQLSPEHLGPVQVHIELQSSQVNVNFTAAHADTRTALAEAVPRLRAMFAAGGLSLGQATVQQEARPDRQPGGGAAPALPALESVEPVAVAARHALGLVDEYA